jgi:hypothetical protein
MDKFSAHLHISTSAHQNMHLLYPAFLFALVSLAIPVLIHLFNFRKYQKVYFSNVQFLKQINEQQSSRRKLKERLILATRLLALSFLVLAFARPYINNGHAINANTQQAVSIFIDNSYSMQTLNSEGSLLDQAKQKAKEIASAYGINDRFQLLTQDFEGRHQRLLSRDEFNDAVDAVKISSQSRNLQQIINRQQSLLTMQATAVKTIYVISDFQKNISAIQSLTSDTGTRINFIQLKASKLPNVAVDSVWLLSAIHRPGESEKLVIRLHNYADAKAEKIPLKVLINKEQKALGSYTVNPRSAQNDTLSFSGLQAAWQQGKVTLQDNPVTFDNDFYFCFDVKQQMPVLLVDDGTANAYLKAVFAADKFFDVKDVPSGNIDYAGLSRYPLIVLSDIKSISAGLAQQLKSYVTKGGSLVVFPSIDADMSSYQALLQPMNAPYPVKLQTAATKVSAINLQSQVFKNTFDSYPQNPDLPVVKKYYQLTSLGNSQNLMSLPGNTPFLTENSSGKGKVYVSAVVLNDDFSNLQRHALFLPILFRIALLSGHDQPLFYTIGQNEAIEIPPMQKGEKQLLKLNKDSISIIPDVRQQEGSTLLFLSDEVQQTGNYNLQKQDSTVAILAFNDNRSESDLTYLTPADLAKILPKSGSILLAGTASLKNAVTDINIGLQLWKLCIILALIFFAAEMLLVRFYKPDKQMFLQAKE